jgi:hypothetical protein
VPSENRLAFVALLSRPSPWAGGLLEPCCVAVQEVQCLVLVGQLNFYSNSFQFVHYFISSQFTEDAPLLGIRVDDGKLI